jgi:hypothetical protein
MRKEGVMARRPRTHRIADRDVATVVAGLDQIEQLIWAVRKILMKAAPSVRIPGGPPCGRGALEAADATTCVDLYKKSGGPPCELSDGGEFARTSRRPSRK